MFRLTALAATLLVLGLISGCGGGDEENKESGTRTGPTETPTYGEFLDDVKAGNVEHVVITANNNVKVTRRNGDRYELGRFVGVRASQELTEIVPALRSKGVKVEVESPAGVVTIRASDGGSDREEGKRLRRLISCLRKNGYEIDIRSTDRRDLRREVPKRNYTISWYEFEGGEAGAACF